MKKNILTLLGVALMATTLFTVGCKKDETTKPSPTVAFTTSTEVTVQPGATVDVAGIAAAAGDAKLKSFKVTFSANGQIATTVYDTTFKSAVANFPFAYTLPTSSVNADLVYTFSATDDNSNTGSGTVTIHVKNAATPFTKVVTGAFFHIQGTLKGAYDLVAETQRSNTDAATSKDMNNTDIAGATFTGSWASLNATTYVKSSTYDYTNATVESATLAYNAGTASTAVINPANGDIYIAKIRGAATYAVIKITNVNSTDNTCACGNKGKITFDFKK